jgi:hypothetical protein
MSEGIAIDTLVLPGLAAADVRRVAAALEVELGRLIAADRARGVAWRGTIETLSLDVPRGADPETLGRALGRALRDRLAVR